MLAEAIQKIRDISKKTVFEIGDHSWTTENLKMIEEPIHRVSPFDINTLTGFKDYVEIEKPPKGSFFRIINHECVVLMSSPDDRDKQRTRFIKSVAISSDYDFERYMGIESFLIELNTSFTEPIPDTGDTVIKDIANALSHIKDQNIVEFQDTGLNQNVTIKNELKSGGDDVTIGIPNPLTLRPFRTFSELEQPQSQFLLRLQKADRGPQVALFESKSKEWQIEAIKKIKTWLEENVPDIPIIA